MQNERPLIFAAACMIFFFLLCDGIVGFFVPIAMQNAGISDIWRGWLIGASSIAGILFDAILLRIFRRATFRRLFFYMMILALLFPFLIWKSSSIILFLIGMIVWGVYYDLYNCGTLDFVGRVSKKDTHASNYGIIASAVALAYMLAPLVASLTVGGLKSGAPFFVALSSLACAMALYALLRRKTNFLTTILLPTSIKKQKSWFEYLLLIRLMFPVLLISTMLNSIESVYWTVAPLITTQIGTSFEFGGVLMFFHQIPSVIFGWYIGKILHGHSKKRFALLSLFVGSLFLALFFLVTNPVALLSIGFLSSFCISMTWPAVSGTYADFVSETPTHEIEIETMQDGFTNVGYVVGPIAAGFSMHYFGVTRTFGVVGLVGMSLVIFLWLIMPQHIRFNQTKLR